MDREVVGPTAGSLRAEIARLRASDPPNELLAIAAADSLTTAQIQREICAELRAHRAELGAYAAMMGRFARPPAGNTFLAFYSMVIEAGPKLHRCADLLGVSEEDRSHRYTTPMENTFNGYVSWLALHGTQAEICMALLSDMDSYFGVCDAIVASAERDGIGLPPEVVGYYRSGDISDFYAATLSTLQDALDRGDDPACAIAAGRFMDEYLRIFWAEVAAA
ncbi:hypothetical protein ABZ436_09275 [Micromonospora matsumotoense]|uniref:hypothetical protein n=1 Tax=Micromonospora matsumotoense TaxID=121616 RepID=UPI0033CEE5BB